MHAFHIGLVSEYTEQENGFHVALDTGKSALLPLDSPVPERFRSGEFGLNLFSRNLGIALTRNKQGGQLWHPACICAPLLGAFFRKHGLLAGMEEWTPEIALHPPLNNTPEQYCPAFGDGTITINLAGMTGSPFYLPAHMPGYVSSGILIREAVENIIVYHEENVFTHKNANRNILQDLAGKNGVSITLSRIDFAFNESYEILYVQSTRCPAQELEQR